MYRCFVQVYSVQLNSFRNMNAAMYTDQRRLLEIMKKDLRGLDLSWIKRLYLFVTDSYKYLQKN